MLNNKERKKNRPKSVPQSDVFILRQYIKSSNHALKDNKIDDKLEKNVLINKNDINNINYSNILNLREYKDDDIKLDKNNENNLN